MNLRHFASAAARAINRHFPDILTGLTGFGVAATMYLTYKSTLKIDEIIKANPEEEITHDTAKKVIIAALPPISAGIASIACAVASNRINVTRIKALNGAYISLQNNYRDYKMAAAGIAGTKVQEAIADAAREKNISQIKSLGLNENGEQLYIFYDEYSRREFVSTIEAVLEAEYILNRNFALRGYATINEFYNLLHIDRWESGDIIGWDICYGEEYYGYTWIDFVNVRHENENGYIWYSIKMPFEPTIDGFTEYM